MQVAQPAVSGRSHVQIGGVWLDRLANNQLVDQVIASSYARRGGWIATPNVSILRKSADDPIVASLLDEATIRVADGAPLVWASRHLPGGPLERVTGASLLLALAEAAATYDRSVYFLGGEDGAAVEAARRLQEQYPNLRVVGAESPWIEAEVSAEAVAPILERLVAAAPDLVFCGFGFPKQERLIQRARAVLPNTWFLGCGAAINFAAGRQRRAPHWVQQCGLEWCFRIAQEPRRLTKRYAKDLRFALRLLGTSARQALTQTPLDIPTGAPVVVPELGASPEVRVVPASNPLPDLRIDLGRQRTELTNDVESNPSVTRSGRASETV